MLRINGLFHYCERDDGREQAIMRATNVHICVPVNTPFSIMRF